MKLKQIPIKDGVKDMFIREGSIWVKAFANTEGLCAMYSLDQTGKHGNLHHLSVSRREKYPEWDEIREAKEEIMGDMDVMMILPKKANYVNVHTNCFHLWETPDSWELR